MSALVVINPTSGGGKGARLGSEVRKITREKSYTFEFIEEPSLEQTLAKLESNLSASHHEVLIAVGGDGLVHHLLPVLLKYKLALLVVPSGTGNDFARSRNLLKVSTATLLSLIERTQPQEIDLGIVYKDGTETPFVQILSSGFDSVVNERANNFTKIGGSLKYAIATLAEVWRFKPLTYSLTVDDQEIHQKAMLVCVANGNVYGGGMKIVPHAKTDDGILDLMFVDPVGPLRLLAVFPRVFFGRHVNHPKVHFHSGKSITLVGDTTAYADGERVASLPIEIAVHPEKLKIYSL